MVGISADNGGSDDDKLGLRNRVDEVKQKMISIEFKLFLKVCIVFILLFIMPHM